jgi:propanediol dehydratase small subunit
MTATVLVIAVMFGISLIAAYFGLNLPKRYRERSCQGRLWRREFPAAPKTEIREFLTLFVKGFAFRESDKLKFHPSDELLQIYRALYPSKWQADALELETFSKLIKSRYGVDLSSIWREDLTLGQVFGATRRDDA